MLLLKVDADISFIILGALGMEWDYLIQMMEGAVVVVGWLAGWSFFVVAT
jgi:hypothetical protein